MSSPRIINHYFTVGKNQIFSKEIKDKRYNQATIVPSKTIEDGDFNFNLLNLFYYL